jgi:hypothetical protein
MEENNIPDSMKMEAPEFSLTSTINGLGVILLILSIIAGFYLILQFGGSGESVDVRTITSGFSIIISGIFFSLLLFGISGILKEVQKIRKSIESTKE